MRSKELANRQSEKEGRQGGQPQSMAETRGIMVCAGCMQCVVWSIYWLHAS